MNTDRPSASAMRGKGKARQVTPPPMKPRSQTRGETDSSGDEAPDDDDRDWR